MNKQVLLDRLKAMASEDRPPEVKLFIRLVAQVWQIDWTVAPYDVAGHFFNFDLPYFLRFMQMDVGDEAEEKQLIIDWIESRSQLRLGPTPDLMNTIYKLIEVREEARRA